MGRLNTYKSSLMYEFAVTRGGACDVSSLWAAGNTEIEVLLRYHEQFCIAYRGVHLLFSVISPAEGTEDVNDCRSDMSPVNNSDSGCC